MLRSSATSLAAGFDLIAFDLDGVVYVGNRAVPHAVSAIGAVRSQGIPVAFVTNNAARPPEAVAAHITELGIAADRHDVVTSAQAAASLLLDLIGPRKRVYVIGGDGLESALTERGLIAVTWSDRSDPPDAVAQGYGPNMPWSRVVAGAILVKSGLPWVATNTDLTIPTADGVGPGNGSLVDLVARFSGREPLVAGKPAPPLLQEVQRQRRAKRPLFVGDRLDTDMAGARSVGWPSLLVRTGVMTLADLAHARPEERPDFISYDLEGLHSPHPVPERVGAGWNLGGWHVLVNVEGAPEVRGSGSADDWWRCVAVASWEFCDTQGGVVRIDDLRPPG